MISVITMYLKEILMKLIFGGIGLLLILPMHTHAMGYSSTYLSCVNSANIGSTTIGSCMKKELNYQEDRLKKVFKATLDLYSDKDQKTQKKFQKHWLKQRDQLCDSSNKSVSEVYKTKYYNCALKQTLNRANTLEKLSYRL